MDLVDLEHPKTKGTCSVPASTAENLICHGGWKRVSGRKSKSTTPTKSSTESTSPPPEPDIPGDGEEDPES